MAHPARPSFLTSLLAVAALATFASVSSSAHAACREGDTALEDERALAAARAQLDEECPCDTFDGSPGRTRTDYLSCVDPKLAALLAQDELSGECAAEASRIVNGSVCGTGGVACATVSGSREPKIGCRVTNAAACRSVSGGRRSRLPLVQRFAGAASLRRPLSPFSRTAATSRACTEETTCADVVEWTAGTCVDTREDGPYAAGFRELRLVKPSAVDGSERALDVVVWYPAPAGSGPIEGPSRAVRDAPLDLTAGPRPLLMFSHGSCGFPRQSLFLTPWLATHGFIVVAPPHPGNTLFEFPDCRAGATQAASAVERPQDVVFTLDHMLAEDQDPASPLFGAIDELRLGMSGHSFGGLTTYLTTAIDDRFVVALPMAPATGPNARLDVASMTMFGEVDSVVNNPATFEAYARSRSPKLLVGIEDAGHYAFSDSCFAGLDCSPPVTLTQDEAHERVKRWVLPFLEVYLAGDASYAPFLRAEPPPGVIVDRD